MSYVTHTSKQVNQKHKQNDVENKKTELHTPPKKEVTQNNNTKDQSFTILEKKQQSSNDEKRKTTLIDSIDDMHSVTQTSKQVNQKHKQNDVENKKMHYIHH